MSVSKVFSTEDVNYYFNFPSVKVSVPGHEGAKNVSYTIGEPVADFKLRVIKAFDLMVYLSEFGIVYEGRELATMPRVTRCVENGLYIRSKIS